MSIRQIERLTGVNRSAIQKARAVGGRLTGALTRHRGLLPSDSALSQRSCPRVSHRSERCVNLLRKLRHRRLSPAAALIREEPGFESGRIIRSFGWEKTNEALSLLKEKGTDRTPDRGKPKRDPKGISCRRPVNGAPLVGARHTGDSSADSLLSQRKQTPVSRLGRC